MDHHQVTKTIRFGRFSDSLESLTSACLKVCNVNTAVWSNGYNQSGLRLQKGKTIKLDDGQLVQQPAVLIPSYDNDGRGVPSNHVCGVECGPSFNFVCEPHAAAFLLVYTMALGDEIETSHLPRALEQQNLVLMHSAFIRSITFRHFFEQGSRGNGACPGQRRKRRRQLRNPYGENASHRGRKARSNRHRPPAHRAPGEPSVREQVRPDGCVVGEEARSPGLLRSHGQGDSG